MGLIKLTVLYTRSPFKKGKNFYLDKYQVDVKLPDIRFIEKSMEYDSETTVRSINRSAIKVAWDAWEFIQKPESKVLFTLQLLRWNAKVIR